MIAGYQYWVNGHGRVNLPLLAVDSAEDKKDEGKRMLRNSTSISKLIMALGFLGLITVLSVSRASAAFTTANYKGSYSCSDANDADFFTAVIQYNPAGTGAYSSGTLVASLNAFAVFNLGAPASQFCTYFLQPATSVYSINSNGLGFETLSWSPSAANDPSCPGAFINETQIALSATQVNGAAKVADFSDDNLLDEDEAGHGYCIQ